jgi:DNA-binding GntR family transcriptional regulator
MTKIVAPHSPDLWDVNPEALFVRLLPERVPPERRNLAARRALMVRVRSEFRELPGLSLTLAQASRLLGVSPEACRRILGGLVQEGAVRLRADGRYVPVAGTASRAVSA